MWLILGLLTALLLALAILAVMQTVTIVQRTDVPVEYVWAFWPMLFIVLLFMPGLIWSWPGLWTDDSV